MSKQFAEGAFRMTAMEKRLADEARALEERRRRQREERDAELMPPPKVTRIGSAVGYAKAPDMNPVRLRMPSRPMRPNPETAGGELSIRLFVACYCVGYRTVLFDIVSHRVPVHAVAKDDRPALSDTEVLPVRRKAMIKRDDKAIIERGLKHIEEDVGDLDLHAHPKTIPPTVRMRAMPPDEVLGTKIEVRESPLGGVGVFATSTLEPQELITEYGGGPVWTDKEEEAYARGAAKLADARAVLVYNPSLHARLERPFPYFRAMSGQEFRDKFDKVLMPGDGLCLFHCIAYVRRNDFRRSYAVRERDEFLERYRLYYKGKRDTHKFMRMASDEEWDDMEHRVVDPHSERGFPNHLAIYMAQEVFDIVIYIWTKVSQRSYEVSLAPCTHTEVASPQFVAHFLHSREGLHYDVVRPRSDFVAIDEDDEVEATKEIDMHGTDEEINPVDEKKAFDDGCGHPVVIDVVEDEDENVQISFARHAGNNDRDCGDFFERLLEFDDDDVGYYCDDDGDHEWLPRDDNRRTSNTHFTGSTPLSGTPSSRSSFRSDLNISDCRRLRNRDATCSTIGGTPARTCATDVNLSRIASTGSDTRDSIGASNESSDSGTVMSFNSRRARPAHAEFMRRLAGDECILRDAESELSGAGTRRCCDAGCVIVQRRAVEDSGTRIGSQLTSNVFADVWQSIRDCRARQVVARYSSHERTQMFMEDYRNGVQIHYPEGMDKEPQLRFTMFVSGREEGDVKLCERTSVCLRAYRIFQGVTGSMHARIMRIIRVHGTSAALPAQVRKAKREVEQSLPECRNLSHAVATCVAFIRWHCELFGEKMPNRNEIRIAYPKKTVYDSYCQTFASCARNDDPMKDDKRPGKPIDLRTFYSTWENHCAYIQPNRWKGEFLVCDVCKEHALRECDPSMSEERRRDNRRSFQQHLKTVQSCRQSYYKHCEMASNHPSVFKSIIMDGCDSNTTMLPSLGTTSKSENRFAQFALKHKLMGVRAHGFRRRDYLLLAGPNLGDAIGTNFSIECLARALRKEAQYHMARREGWPRKLFLQLDNTSKENKNKYMFAYLSHLAQRDVFKEIEVNFLPVGHTHEDIDQLFSVLTRRLRQVSVFTFPQWRDEMFNAFNDERERVSSVEYVHAVNDYRKWLTPGLLSGYQGYRSTAYHFYITKTSPESLPVCYYQQFGYQVANHGRKPELPLQPESWLDSRKLLAESPTVDETAGSWTEPRESGARASRVAVDVQSRLEGLTALMSLPQNRATPEDIAWWTAFFEDMPRYPDKPPTEEQIWRYELPDVRALNDNASAERIDLCALDDVEPIPAPDGELLLSKHVTAAMRRKLQRLATENRTMTTCQSVQKNQFVIFRIDSDWADLAASTHGMHPDSLSWGFLLGKVERAEPVQDDSDADSQTIAVHVWYPASGDVNGKWSPWLRKHDDGGHSAWIKEIPQHSIALTNIIWRKSNKYFVSETKQAICELPGLNLHYTPKIGITREDDAMTRLQARLDETQDATSKKALREQRKAETSMRKARALKRVKQLQQTPGNALSRPARLAKAKTLSYKELVSSDDDDDAQSRDSSYHEEEQRDAVVRLARKRRLQQPALGDAVGSAEDAGNYGGEEHAEDDY